MAQYEVKTAEGIKVVNLSEDEERAILQKRTSINLYIDRLDGYDDLTDEEAGRIFKAILNYRINGEPPEIMGDRFLNHFLKNVCSPFEYDDRKYIEKTLRNRENSKNAGRPPKIQKNPEESSGLF